MKQSKILLVEDDEQLGEAYATHLKAEGMDVLWVKNGEEALAETVSFVPDILLLDIMMPRISGFDVLDILKNTPETRDTDIIVLSALSSPEDVEKAKLLGASDYLVKAQVTASDIVKVIHRHIGSTEGSAATSDPLPTNSVQDGVNEQPAQKAPSVEQSVNSTPAEPSNDSRPADSPNSTNDPSDSMDIRGGVGNSPSDYTQASESNQSIE